MNRRCFIRLCCKALAAGAAGLLSGCAAPQPESTAAAGLHVVCTMFPQYDLLRAIGGGRLTLTLLVAPGMEAHGFSPTAQNMVDAGAADLLVLAGGDADAWAQRILDSIDTAAVQTVRLPALLAPDEVCADEHIWTSPRKVLQLIDGLRDLLTALDPAGAAIYQKNAAAYRTEWETLDAQFTALGAAAAQPFVLGDRQPFSCLAADYTLSFAAAFDGCSTDTEVSAARMAALTDLVQTQGISTVFYLELSDRSLCDTLAEATGAAVVQLDSGQTISRADFEAGRTLADLLGRDCRALADA